MIISLTALRYLTRDISELLNRYEKYKFDKMIYVIASEQDLHVKQFFKVSTEKYIVIIESLTKIIDCPNDGS
jgi:arginyl-tRNA synthetase